MTDDERLSALAAVEDIVVRSLFVDMNSRIKGLETTEAIVLRSFTFLRWILPIVATAAGVLLGKYA